MEQPVSVVYIAAKGHSGSTLLDLLLSSHSRIASVGELKMLSRRKEERRFLTRKRCACGAETPLACPFWCAVDERLRRAAGFSLWEADPEAEEDGAFARQNRALYQAVAAVSGRPFVVDSSKGGRRLARLLSVEGLAVKPLHLVRSPWGVVYSNVKRGRDWREHAAQYTRAVLSARRLLRGVDHRVVRYETLARQPARTLRAILAWLNLEFEPAMLRWTEHEHHNFAGNSMRYDRSGEIRLDDSWKRGLTLAQQAGVALKTLPALAARWLP